MHVKVLSLSQPSFREVNCLAENQLGKAVANLQPSLPLQPRRRASWLFRFAVPHVYSSWIPASLPSDLAVVAGIVAAAPSSLQQSWRNRFPLPFLFGSSNFFLARNSCSLAPVVQPERLSSGTPQTELMLAALDQDPPFFFFLFSFFIFFLLIEFSFCFTRQIICCDSYCFLSFAAWTGSMHHFVLKDA